MPHFTLPPNPGQVHRPEIHTTLDSLKAALEKREAYQETFDAIEALFSEKRWSRDVNPLGESEFTGAGDVLRVAVNRRGSWVMQSFSKATETYQTIRQGESLADLQRALYA